MYENKTTKTTNTVNNELRDRLFQQYMPLANRLAQKKQQKMPRCVQLEDLRSAAHAGLLDAAAKYDETKHERFAVYARIRILGEINDYLRKCTWGGRNKQFYAWSLDVPVHGSRNRRPIPLEESLTDDQELTMTEADEFFTELTRSLPAKARRIFRYYFLDGLTMKEISFIEGMSESRVSQVMSHYKDFLKKVWDGKESDLWTAAKREQPKEKYRFSLPSSSGNGKEVT